LAANRAQKKPSAGRLELHPTNRRATEAPQNGLAYTLLPPTAVSKEDKDVSGLPRQAGVQAKAARAAVPAAGEDFISCHLNNSHGGNERERCRTWTIYSLSSFAWSGGCRIAPCPGFGSFIQGGFAAGLAALAAADSVLSCLGEPAADGRVHPAEQQAHRSCYRREGTQSWVLGPP
jgi:hypothetical protein